jgi:hypothetical protein
MVYASIGDLQDDLDLWVKNYNEERPHQGRWCFGKTPLQTFLDRRRAQLAAAGAAEASQLALFATLHDDRRPPAERTASGRYLQPCLFENQAAQTRESRL